MFRWLRQSTQFNARIDPRKDFSAVFILDLIERLRSVARRVDAAAAGWALAGIYHSLSGWIYGIGNAINMSCLFSPDINPMHRRFASTRASFTRFAAPMKFAARCSVKDKYLCGLLRFSGRSNVVTCLFDSCNHNCRSSFNVSIWRMPCAKLFRALRTECNGSRTASSINPNEYATSIQEEKLPRGFPSPRSRFLVEVDTVQEMRYS